MLAFFDAGTNFEYGLPNPIFLIMHCCVIGGTGFIGTYLVKSLLATGREVTVIGRSTRPTTVLPHTVRYLSNPYGEPYFFEQALQGVDEIVDLAYSTIPKTSFTDPINDIVKNLPEAVRLFEIATKLPIKKLVWISSGGTVYGNCNVSPIDESQPTYPVSPYGITKLAIEKYALMYHFSSGLPVVCVRPANAYGEQQKAYTGQGFIATAIASVINNRSITLFGKEGTIRDYIHVQDVVSGIIAALERGIPGSIYNIGSGEGRTTMAVLESIRPYAEAAGLEIHVQTLPIRQFDVRSNVLDSSRLTNDTGWHAGIDFKRGVKQTWDWFMENLNK